MILLFGVYTLPATGKRVVTAETALDLSKVLGTSAKLWMNFQTTDELMLEAAVNGQAQTIVTHNIRDFQPAAGAFGIKVMTPAALLKELKK